ncbi:Putative DNA repair helicase RadD [Pontiella desulfatans]|uniref:DNA repair helicase RadD n=1 Tax=Pontiella desulfatans TaxID=2750659 RepID=A0A6C2U4L8_PONDE|nr:DEAD/DEAH box helicase [Pontiella desulfatans]VGO14767.1 Putative DNA repair helicase RadD [Pontiella desulfatans]
MQLRPYQSQAIEAINREWCDGNHRTLLVLPTGCGKTIVFCKLAEKEVGAGKRVLILAHRGELLEQAADKMAKATGLGCAVEKAEQTSIGEWYRIVVGSVQTLMRERRLQLFAPDHFDTIIVDEAHHVLSDSYLRVLNHFCGANVLGVTATPDRGDMRNLGEFFDSLAYEYHLPQAIREGFLSPIKAQTIPIKLDLSGVKKTAGDYNAGALGNALDPYLASIADEMASRCQGRKTVVFTPLIATSKKLQGMLAERGMKVDEVNGESADRKEILTRFDKQEGGVLLNSMLLTEGWDCPSVDCVIVLRATKVRALYCQMVGRGTRLHPGKDHLLLLDFLWHSDRLELCRPAHLVCESDEVAQTMTESINESGAAVDVSEAVERAEEDTVAAREEALAKMLEEMKHKAAKLVDPVQYEHSIRDPDLVNYVPAFGWETGAPKPEQLETLAKLDINPVGIESAGKAAKLIESVKARRKSNLATPKQIRLLERKGFQHVGNWTKAQASGLVDRIAANRWQTPKGIDPKTYQPPEAKRTPLLTEFG